MNIVLIPHNWTRHVAVAFYTGAVPVLIWWILLNWLIALGPTLYEEGLLWSPSAEGPILLGFMSAGIAWVHIAAEGGLRRRALLWKVLLPFFAALLAMLLAVLSVVLVELLTPFLVGAVYADFGELYADPHTVTLRHRVLEFLLAGWAVGVSTLAIRGIWGFMGALARFIPDAAKPFIEIPENPAKSSFGIAFNHLFSGMASALLGAAVWHLCAHVIFKDMYLATAIGFGVWGFTFGLMAWGVPANLYAGWIRILSAHRYGHRIPIDKPEGGPVERVAGHYPRGLDLWVGAEHGVAELHASFVADGEGGYAVRGLSQQPMRVKRSLESIDLSYDPVSPVPLETDLRMEDRVYVGPKKNATLVEFILLPKEER